MIKPLNTLGNNWIEVSANIVLIILMAPFLLIIVASLWVFIIAPMEAWRWLRKEPRLKVPEVAGVLTDDMDMDMNEYIDCYISQAKTLVSDVDIQVEQPIGFMKGFSFHTARAKEFPVKLYYKGSLAGFRVGKIRSGSWHTNEDDSLDLFFWIIIGILRYGAFRDVNILGFKRYWVKVDELNVWVKVFPEEYDVIDTFFTPYRKPPKKVLLDFEAQQPVLR